MHQKTTFSLLVSILKRNHPQPLSLQQSHKNYSKKVTPVDLAYTSLENVKSPDRKTTPPLVIMHGLNGSKKNFNSLSLKLHEKTQPQRTIITVDARNHGDSPHSPTHTYPDLAEDIVALLKKLHIKKAALMGHSMGGRTMMYCALKNPEAVEKLIVIDISPVSSQGLSLWLQCLNAVAEMPLPKKDTPMPLARREIDKKLSQHVTNKELREFLLTNLIHKVDTGYAWRMNLDVLVKHIRHITSFPHIGSLQFHGPVLFVCGKKSEHLPTSDHDKIKQIFPNATFEYVEGAEHWVHSDKPREFAEICLKFLNNTD